MSTGDPPTVPLMVTNKIVNCQTEVFFEVEWQPNVTLRHLADARVLLIRFHNMAVSGALNQTLVVTGDEALFSGLGNTTWGKIRTGLINLGICSISLVFAFVCKDMNYIQVIFFTNLCIVFSEDHVNVVKMFEN